VFAAQAVSRPATRTWLRWLLAAAVVAASLAVSAGATYACGTPIDLVRAANQLPGGTSLATENSPAFLAHKGIALALDAAGCNPAAGGLQWIKAAAHTIRPDRGQEVIDGLRGEAARGRSPEALAAELCGYLRPGSGLERQQRELAAAGLPCSALHTY
jgi:hypothetical protein